MTTSWQGQTGAISITCWFASSGAKFTTTPANSLHTSYASVIMISFRMDNKKDGLGLFCILWPKIHLRNSYMVSLKQIPRSCFLGIWIPLQTIPVTGVEVLLRTGIATGMVLEQDPACYVLQGIPFLEPPTMYVRPSLQVLVRRDRDCMVLLVSHVLPMQPVMMVTTELVLSSIVMLVICTIPRWDCVEVLCWNCVGPCFYLMCVCCWIGVVWAHLCGLSSTQYHLL